MTNIAQLALAFAPPCTPAEAMEYLADTFHWINSETGVRAKDGDLRISRAGPWTYDEFGGAFRLIFDMKPLVETNEAYLDFTEELSRTARPCDGPLPQMIVFKRRDDATWEFVETYGQLGNYQHSNPNYAAQGYYGKSDTTL